MQGLLPLIGASVAVIALVALSAWLGFRGQPQLQGADEAALLAGDLPGGFIPGAVTLDRNRAAALVSDGRNRIALIAPHGAHFIAREVGRLDRVERAGDRLTITSGRSAVELILGAEAERWHALIAQARGSVGSRE